MLKYLNAGPRWYGNDPVWVNPRVNWEFEAVLRGRISPTLSGGAPPVFRERTLWVFPPRHFHGWTGIKGEEAEIVVFHFGTVPAALERYAVPRGGMSAPLSRETVSGLRALARSVRPHFERPGPRSLIRFQQALLDLSWIALEGVPDADLGGPMDLAAHKVDAALAYFDEHMAEHATFGSVAKAVHTSQRNLRRFFRRAYKKSPARVLREARIRRAVQLLSGGPLKLSLVARQCGFSDPASFSRSFKSVQGMSPRAWRDERRGW